MVDNALGTYLGNIEQINLFNTENYVEPEIEEDEQEQTPEVGEGKSPRQS